MNFTHTEFGWEDAEHTHAHQYILPKLLELVSSISGGKPMEILDIGCGNGSVSAQLAEFGHIITGIDASPDGIEIARSSYPNVQFKVASVYSDDDLNRVTDEQVDCVISLEVVEHLFYPAKLFQQSHKVIKEGGHLIISTPYHGYMKNLVISLVNGWDRHFTVDHDGGHIKFFSQNTLARMAGDVGFNKIRFFGVGRLPWLWKSMIMIAEK